ncbi:uncharacterized protein A1O5_07256 [Cladophialophora psammophila CBS 110553]|uniref:Uncharacterized protein n=1 Tax=Cladophialophora psammophila CBS 110553 TaxID=1182543 RepID=W9WVX6_9EURO|nr:uncharacterized protein A1O5_07256 [Cladophialophora psammophila CBS 110553]EXJ69220.1 hypothetical protein A1O5_07256 [Cladophialophora psammophila CBS 110553]
MEPTTNLATAPGNETKKLIGRAFFGDTFDDHGGLEAFQDYFRYYEGEIAWLRGGTHQIAGIVTQSHEDVVTIAKLLRQHPDCEKSEIRQKLRAVHHFGHAEDWVLNRSIDLSLRLWLQINVRDDESSTGVPQVHWDEDVVLADFLAGLFPVEDWELGAKERRLDPYFTAANMVQFCQLKVDWTNSLEDHLRLERREKKEKVLWVYPHKQTLQALLVEAEKVPATVLKETIQTLDLLFPFWDTRTKTLLEQNGQTFHNISGPIEQGRRLHLLDFPHWKVRLLEVYEEVFQSPPVSWAQLWHDQRNPQQFWTFWIALVILALTLVSTIASIVSMITGIIQVKLARQALSLSLQTMSSSSHRFHSSSL